MPDASLPNPDSVKPDQKPDLDLESTIYLLSPEALAQYEIASQNYRRHNGKEGPRTIQLRDVVDVRNGIELNPENPLHMLLYKLIDLPIVQRMRDVSQLGTAQYAYKEGTHYRFSHAVGSAYLACQVLDSMRSSANHLAAKEIEQYAPAVVAATLLHDVGHIAPRSHLAEGIWFPGEKKAHERITGRFVEADRGLEYVLKSAFPKFPELPEIVKQILAESEDIPPWTWKLVSGGGWNLDRGDWVPRDGIECGVEYGAYAIKPLIKRLSITEDGELVVNSAGVRLVQGFFQARYEMYDHLYFHPVCRVAVKMFQLLGERARGLFKEGGDVFADELMQKALAAEKSDDMAVPDLLEMTDSWFKYHMERWAKSEDPVLSDLASRLIVRKLFKRFPDDDYHRRLLGKLIDAAGLPREYYLAELKPYKASEKAKEDLGKKALLVKGEDGSLKTLAEDDKLLSAYIGADSVAGHSLLAFPADIFFTGSPAIH